MIKILYSRNIFVRSKRRKSVVLFVSGRGARWQCRTSEFWRRVWSEDWTCPPPGIKSVVKPKHLNVFDFFTIL